MMLRKLIAVDPSLTCSGWAMFCAQSARLISVGKIKSLPPSRPLAVRLKDLQVKVSTLFELLEIDGNDVLVCEAPTTMRDPRAAFKVEQVRCIFEDLARTRECKVPGRINPRSIQFEAMGLRGKQVKRSIVKDTALIVVERVHGDNLRGLGFDPSPHHLRRHQDIVDAVLVGQVSLSWIQTALRAGCPLEQYFDQGRKDRSSWRRASAA